MRDRNGMLHNQRKRKQKFYQELGRGNAYLVLVFSVKHGQGLYTFISINKVLELQKTCEFNPSFLIIYNIS